MQDKISCLIKELNKEIKKRITYNNILINKDFKAEKRNKNIFILLFIFDFYWEVGNIILLIICIQAEASLS